MSDSAKSELMLVLASSRKNGGRCIAGLSVDNDRLVRPVSEGGTGELYFSNCAVEGNWPKELDLVRFDHVGPEGRTDQPENVVIDGTAWAKLDDLGWDDIEEVVEPHLHRAGPLLGNFDSSLPAEVVAEGVEASLALVEPDNLRFEKESVPWNSGVRLSARFEVGGQQYFLRLTDFEVSARLARRDYGRYTLAELELAAERVLLTVSLAPAFHGNHYKLVAAVLLLG